MSSHADISIQNARGTIYFIDDGSGLRQGYDLTIYCAAAAPCAPVTARWPGGESLCDIGPVREGESTVRVYIPDIREPVRLEFSSPGGRSFAVDHRPQRHWTVHIIQFAHHDLGYTDLPSNVLREMAGFLDDALRFCSETDHFPDNSRFRYTIEQGWSLIYWMQNRPPEAQGEMIRRIREGRIEVNAFVGNEVTELLGPEEMARMLYPVFALKRKYGIPVVCAEHNDIPGISWGVASAMSAAGIRYFAPGLPDYFRWGGKYHTFWDESAVCPNDDRPYAFWWEAQSGDRILFWYGREGAAGSIDVSLSHIPGYLEKLEQTDYPYDVLRCIVRGGDRDNSNTRVEFAYSARDWNSRWAYPRLVPSLNSRFFPELERELAADTPVFRGELPATDYSLAASCTAYPSSLNRTAHDWLLAAERFAAVASFVSTYQYQRQSLDEAYYCTLMNDEHAWGLAHPTGPGQDACIAQHCEFAYRAAALAHDVLTKSVNEIADQIRRDRDGYHAVVFNPLTFTRTDVATAPARPMDPCARPMRPDPLRRTDSDGRPIAFYSFPVGSRGQAAIPMELIENGLEVIDVSTGEVVEHEIYVIPDARAPVPHAAYRYAMSRHDPGEGIEVRFVARDIPAMGYKLYRFAPAGTSKAGSARDSGGPRVVAGPNTLENNFYRIELDPATGAISSIRDKQLDRELVDRGAEHGVNQLVIRSSLTAEKSTVDGVSIERGRTGRVSASLVVKASAPGCPQVTQEIVLYSDTKRIDIANRLLKDSAAHLETFFAFPFAFDGPRFRYEGSLSVVQPLADQFPGSNSEYHCVQHWADVSDERAGVTLASVDAPVMQFGGNWTLYVSQAHHGVTPPGFDHPFHAAGDVGKGHLYSLALLNNYRTNFAPAQCGDLLFRYSIASHEGDWIKGRSRDFGYSVGLPLVTASVDGAGGGGLPASSSFVQIDRPNVILLTLKRAEDSTGLIARVMETEGQDTEFTITVPFVSLLQAFETNLVEENIRLLPISEHSVTARVRAWATATCRLVTQ